MKRKFEPGDIVAVHNILYNMETFMNSLDHAEKRGLFFHKLKNYGNLFRKEMRARFSMVFGDLSNIDQENYDDIYHWIGHAVMIYSSFKKLSEDEKIKYLSAYENFVTINLRTNESRSGVGNDKDHK